MGICDKCKRLCPSTKMRQGGDPLCDECETKRIATLACEQQQRKLRSSMRAAGGETSTMDTESTQAAAAAEPPRDGQPSADVVTAHSETSPASRNDAAHSETPPLQSPDIHCLEHCRHGRSGDGDMIRCCVCFRWHHEQCVSDGSIRQDTPWWLCPSCRSLPDTVRVMSDMIQSLQQSMDAMLATNNKLVNSVKDLTVKNEQLSDQISSLSCDRSEQSSGSNANVPNLLIGASTIRDIACTDPSALYIISRGGAKTGDVFKTLRDTNTDAYADVTIHVGTNDCSTKFPVDKIADNIREISNQAKRVSRSGCVTFSSITPRIDNVAAAEKSIRVNELMKSIAEETGCLFVNNQDNFLCRNGDINEELLSIDGLHLSKLGTERLINNLKLAKTTCCRIGRTQRPGGEPQLKQWSADHARSAPSQAAKRPKPGGISESFRRPAGPVSGRPMRHNRRPMQSRDNARPPSQQQNSRRFNPETFVTDATHFEGANNVRHCTYCGEMNHRSHVCRFGMPVNCFRCHRQGHKENFCKYYPWRAG